MNTLVECQSLAEVRHEIDRIDLAMLRLLAERGAYVRQAARFKQNAAEVPAPARVAQVLEQVQSHALSVGADPKVARATWEAMIHAFIQAERQVFESLHPPSSSPN